MRERADIAIEMLARLPGTRVFPLPPLTKTPQGGSWKNSATDDPNTVQEWFNALATGNVGFVIGDRVAVIDVEGPKKKREEAREGLAELTSLEQTYGNLPPTITVLTPSGGRHQYYVMPPGVVINRKASFLGAKGIEFRSGAHYVILPPSRIDNPKEGTGDYLFADGLGLGEVEVATLPDAWVQAILKYEEPEKATSSRLSELFPASSVPSDNKPRFEPIVAGCAFMQHVVDDAEKLTEPEWYAALSVVGHCERGRELAHKISEPHPGYSGAQTDQKLEHAVTAAKPTTCQFVASNLGFEGCKRCPFRAADMKSPVKLGYQKDHLIREQSRLVYVAEIERYVDTKTGRRYTRTNLSDMLSHRVGKNPHGQLMASGTMPKVECTDYVVGNDQLIIDTDAGKVLNLWRRDGVEPCEGDSSVLIQFIEYLIPDQISREHLLNYVAHLLKSRGEKIAHALILTGPQGTGKSTFNRIVQKLFGRNARKIEGEQLSSRWTEALVNCEILIGEEAAHGEKFETYERLKELITGETYTAEQKNMPTYEAKTPRGIVIASNHDNPLAIAANDRRFCVLASAEEKADAAFYEMVNEAMDDDRQLGAFANLLLKRDIAKFNPKVAPPVTAAKETAIAASRTLLGQALDTVIESENLWQEVITIEQVRRILVHSSWATGSNLTYHKIAKELRNRGAIPLEKTRTSDGLVRPWAIRNTATWKNATADEIRRELHRSPSAEKLAQMPNVVAMALLSTPTAQEVH